MQSSYVRVKREGERNKRKAREMETRFHGHGAECCTAEALCHHHVAVPCPASLCLYSPALKAVPASDSAPSLVNNTTTK